MVAIIISMYIDDYNSNWSDWYCRAGCFKKAKEKHLVYVQIK
ncbi:protein of unknown function [Clostridium beijerinckii]|nr:protein of unknown function [Clostridium beijerinckii]